MGTVSPKATCSSHLWVRICGAERSIGNAIEIAQQHEFERVGIQLCGSVRRSGMSASELPQRIPDPEVLLTLEPEELAGVLLPILHKAGASYQGKVSGYNFCNKLNQFQEVYPRQFL
jgi:hypothetical protein